MNTQQRKINAIREVLKSYIPPKDVTVKPVKAYKSVHFDTCAIRPDTSLEWRFQGESSYANEFTSFDQRR